MLCVSRILSYNVRTGRLDLHVSEPQVRLMGRELSPRELVSSKIFNPPFSVLLLYMVFVGSGLMGKQNNIHQPFPSVTYNNSWIL